MACPILKTLRISFTPPVPAPDNGYRVKWRVVGTSTYTTVSQVFTTSPITLSNIPACENVEGTIESICGAVYSTVVTFSATKEQSYVCGSNITGGQLSSQFMTYPPRLIDTQNSGNTVVIAYNANDVPNRFNVYNSNNELVASSSWVGTASYAGPWGLTLNTSASGTLTINKSTAGGDQRYYYIVVEHAGNASLADAWNIGISCSGTGGSGGTPTATWVVTPSVSTVTEGNSVTFNVTAPAGTTGTYYWTIAGMQQADFDDYQNAGQFTMTNGVGSIVRAITNDTVTEGDETFTLSVRSGSTSGTVLATSTAVTVTDLVPGTGGGTPTYSATASSMTLNEGDTVTINVTTTNVPNNTLLYYSIENVEAADFTDNSLTGSFSINNNQGSFSKTIKPDVLTEGPQSFNVRIRINSVTNTIVTSVFGIAITDTSLDGGTASATYTLTALNENSSPISSINEGNNLTIKLTTTGVNDGTLIPYTVTGITSADLGGVSDALSGNFNITAGQAVKNFYIAADQTTDGLENFVLSLTGLSKSITVPIIDTSVPISWGNVILTPVTSSDCTATGPEITASRQASGSILVGETLYSSQNVNAFLATGNYSDGTYNYTVNNGVVTQKVNCPTGGSQPTYDLVTRVGGNIVASINEGQTVVFTLVTENVPNGTVVPYVISGINQADLSSGNVTGNFTVGSANTASFTLALDLTTEGTETMTMTLPNSNTVKSITIGDESITPAVYYELNSCTSGGAPAYTKIAPTLGIGQRYVNPSGMLFYTYAGVSTTFSSLPSGYSGSIQATQDTGCPS